MLGTIATVSIADADVVTKSYPGFWKDLIALGFMVENIEI